MKGHRACTGLIIGAMGLGGLFSPALAAPDGQAKRVVVIPLTTLNVPSEQQWIGKGAQETLIADLGKDKAFDPVAFGGQTIVEDNKTAARIAREASAALALRGSVQVVNKELRLTAQLISADSGDTVATAIATGAAADVLKLEDDLAAQLVGGPAPMAAAPLSPATVTVPPAPQAPAPAVYTTPEVYPPPPFNDISLSAQNYNAPSYNPGYAYPGYGYPTYPIYYPTYTLPVFSRIIISGGNCGGRFPIHHRFPICRPPIFHPFPGHGGGRHALPAPRFGGRLGGAPAMQVGFRSGVGGGFGRGFSTGGFGGGMHFAGGRR